MAPKKKATQKATKNNNIDSDNHSEQSVDSRQMRVDHLNVIRSVERIATKRATEAALKKLKGKGKTLLNEVERERNDANVDNRNNNNGDVNKNNNNNGDVNANNNNNAVVNSNNNHIESAVANKDDDSDYDINATPAHPTCLTVNDNSQEYPSVSNKVEPPKKDDKKDKEDHLHLTIHSRTKKNNGISASLKLALENYVKNNPKKVNTAVAVGTATTSIGRVFAESELGVHDAFAGPAMFAASAGATLAVLQTGEFVWNGLNYAYNAFTNNNNNNDVNNNNANLNDVMDVDGNGTESSRNFGNHKPTN